MAGRFKDVTISSETYKIPLQGADAPWGEELSDLLNAMVEVLNLTSGPSDITETSATILNTAGIKSIVGLAFNPNTVRSAEISYNFDRLITKTISAIPTGTGVIQIDSLDNHNLFTGDQIVIINSDSTPSIDGTYTVTYVDDNSISIDIGIIEVLVAGASGTFNVQLIESGVLVVNYGLQGWNLARFHTGDAMVDIDISATGQATYNPTILDGINHDGTMKFIAKALLSA